MDVLSRETGSSSIIKAIEVRLILILAYYQSGQVDLKLPGKLDRISFLII